MAFHDVPPQSKILYNKKWSFSMDKCFLVELLVQQRIGYWRLGELNIHATLIALGAVNLTFGSNLSLEDAQERVAELEMRYLMFKKTIEETMESGIGSSTRLVEHEGSGRKYYKVNLSGRHFNHCSVPPLVDEASPSPAKLLRVNEKAMQAKGSGGPCPTLVVIYSDNSGKVESPMVVEKSKAKKRLFNELEPINSLDAQSTNLIDPYNLTYGVSCMDRFPPRVAFPLMSNFNEEPSKNSGRSSYASSSLG